MDFFYKKFIILKNAEKPLGSDCHKIQGLLITSMKIAYFHFLIWYGGEKSFPYILSSSGWSDSKTGMKQVNRRI